MLRIGRLKRFTAALETMLLAVALAGCMPRCSCDGVDARTDIAKPSSTANGGAGTGAPGSNAMPATAANVPPAPAVSLPPASTATAPSVNEPPAPALRMTQVFPDAPGAAAQAQLATLGRKLTGSPPPAPAKLKDSKTLARLVPDRLLRFSAAAAPFDGPTKAGDLPVAVVARNYRDEARQLYVKVTDTGLAPFMRAPVLQRLSSVGTAPSGFLHGRLAGGYPAVVQYYPQARSSQVIALVGDRYVVEVRLSPANSPTEALDVLSKLDLAKLAPPDLR